MLLPQEIKIMIEIVCTDSAIAKKLKQFFADEGHDIECLTVEEAETKYGDDLPEMMGYDSLEVDLAYFNWFMSAAKKNYYEGSTYYPEFVSAFLSRRQLIHKSVAPPLPT